MKKINGTGQTGGAPVNQEDLRTVFNDEIWDAIEALLSSFSADTEGVIVSGCVISGGGPYDISAGIVYLNGEFMRLAAATGQTLPKYIQPATAVNDNRVFADQTTKTLFITKAAELAGSAPGGSQYVAITSTTDPDDRRWNPIIPSARKREEILPIGSWNMDTTSSKLVAHGLSDITKIISVTASIRNDAGTSVFPILVGYQNAVTGLDLFCSVITSTDVSLTRVGGSIFDGTDYDDAVISRGNLLIEVAL